MGWEAVTRTDQQMQAQSSNPRSSSLWDLEAVCALLGALFLPLYEEGVASANMHECLA